MSRADASPHNAYSFDDANLRGYAPDPSGQRFLFIMADARTNVPADHLVVGWNSGLD